MMPVVHKFFCVCCAVGTALALTGCAGSGRATEPTREEIITLPTAPVATEATLDPSLEAEHLTVVMEAGELYLLDQYPNLRTLDLTGSTCYEAILHYMENHPQVEVTYSVDLGGSTVSSWDTSASLAAGTFDNAVLFENLKYLPNLTALSFPGIRLTGEELTALREAYPDITLDYTVELMGTTYPSGTTELDLSAMGSGSVDEAVGKLAMLTDLETVRLGNGLSMADVARLQDANPNALFQYTFTLFGKTLSTADETVTFQNTAIGNEGEEKIRQALDILDNCQRFVLDNCQMDSEILARIREAYRDKTTVAWRVYFGVTNRYNAMTDDETIRAVYNVTDDTVGPLKYCEGAKYIDMGHNDYLTDLSFLANMPELEVLIVSGCAATDLTGIENCKKLTWLELANCMKLENIDPVAGCESLRFLNLSNTKVKSFEVLDGLPLERFKYVNCKASKDERTAFGEIHPECMVSYSGNVYGQAWRYDDNGKTYNEYYKTVIREVFDLDRLEAIVRAQEAAKK